MTFLFLVSHGMLQNTWFFFKDDYKTYYEREREQEREREGGNL